MEIITLIELGIYETFHASLKKASELEQQVREGKGDFNYAQGDTIKQLEHLSANELPVYMGKLISELGLQPQFQSLGRYIRSFTDAEYVVRNLREQILGRLAGAGSAHAAIRGLVTCTDSITGASDTAAEVYS